jgi:hypothetical protein
LFAVFVTPHPVAATKRDLPKPAVFYKVDLTGPWRVRFTERLESPLEITLDKLSSWSEHPNEDIKYYSGTATYTTEFVAPPEVVESEQQVHLVLGEVRDLVEVWLNGTHLGVLWKPYFHIEITRALRAGNNTLELAVTNTWRNRLIGDYGKPEGERKAFVLPRLRKGQEWLPGGPGTVLSPAGLLGPAFVSGGGGSVA